MPTVFRSGGFRFFFYVNDHSPLHIHLDKGEETAKFLLQAVELVKSKRMNSSELAQVRRLIFKNLELLKTKWNDHINSE